MKRSIRRRRLEAKTDYRARIELLKPGRPRLVVRRTNRYLIAQLAVSTVAQDSILASSSSRQLLSKGWPEEAKGRLKSLPAAYLTGLLIGNAARQHNIKEAILDIGLQRNIQKSRLYAVLKGALDTGLEIPHSAEALPTDEQLASNTKLAGIVTKLREKLHHG